MTVLVTGGGGFLGQALCRALIARGVPVRSLARGHYPALAELGIETVRGDISARDDVVSAATGCDALFHVAAKAGVWGPAAEYHQINVVGTQNVLEACRVHHIPRLIYTSSPSVVYSGLDEAGVNESVPYPDTYLTHYPRTKAEAERAVLSANGPALSTIALRPHLIWGPGDNHLLPRLISRAQSGKLRRVGDGTNLVDTTYIDNAVAAHLAAYDRLSPNAECAGKAYFIANNEPRPLWELIDQMLDCAGLPPVQRSISATAAYGIGAVLEGLYTVLRIREELPMSRFVARQLSTDHWYDLSAAINDLGYQPAVTVDEGLRRLRESLARPT